MNSAQRRRQVAEIQTGLICDNRAAREGRGNVVQCTVLDDLAGVSEDFEGFAIEHSPLGAVLKLVAIEGNQSERGLRYVDLPVDGEDATCDTADDGAKGIH